MRPVLLVIEDLHWADSASLDAVSFLLRCLHAERIGVVMTFRSDELHRGHPLRRWLGEVERLETVGRLELGPLAPAETGELIAAILGAEPNPELVAHIHQRSDGNPLYIEELLARGDSADEDSLLSPGLRDILLARIGSVPSEAQALLSVAAVAGRRTDVAVLARVAGATQRPFDTALEACLDRHLLVAGRDGTRGQVAFRHALVKEVAYDTILPGECIRLHRAWAEALEEASTRTMEPAPWAEIAHHWDAARDEPHTLEAALRAAGEGERAFASGAALAQYRRALAAWEVVPDPVSVAEFDRIELLSRAAGARSGTASVCSASASRPRETSRSSPGIGGIPRRRPRPWRPPHGCAGVSPLRWRRSRAWTEGWQSSSARSWRPRRPNRPGSTGRAIPWSGRRRPTGG